MSESFADESAFLEHLVHEATEDRRHYHDHDYARRTSQRDLTRLCAKEGRPLCLVEQALRTVYDNGHDNTTRSAPPPVSKPKGKPQRIKLRTEPVKPGPPLLLRWRVAFSDEPKARLDANTKHVLWAISRYFDKHGCGAFPSQKTLAAKCSLSVPTVRSALRKALKAGWLKRTVRESQHGGFTGYAYEATLPNAK
jgi:hypothetical protein